MEVSKLEILLQLLEKYFFNNWVFPTDISSIHDELDIADAGDWISEEDLEKILANSKIETISPERAIESVGDMQAFDDLGRKSFEEIAKGKYGGLLKAFQENKPVPMPVFEEDSILDGRHRTLLAGMLGIPVKAIIIPFIIDHKESTDKKQEWIRKALKGI
jgi:hypothetical protein